MPSLMTAFERDPVDPPEAAGGDAGGLRDVGRQLAGDQVAHDGAVAAARVVDQRDRLAALMDGDDSATAWSLTA